MGITLKATSLVFIKYYAFFGIIINENNIINANEVDHMRPQTFE